MVPAGQGVAVSWRPRGAGESRTDRYDAVVNCTGPSSDVRRVDDPLIANMLARGQLRPDGLGLGLETDSEYRLLASDGRPSRHVRYVGPLLKAQWWEATAVPELRQHAARVAASMLDGL